jgi:hypothetical protein
MFVLMFEACDAALDIFPRHVPTKIRYISCVHNDGENYDILQTCLQV